MPYSNIKQTQWWIWKRFLIVANVDVSEYKDCDGNDDDCITSTHIVYVWLLYVCIENECNDERDKLIANILQTT